MALQAGEKVGFDNEVPSSSLRKSVTGYIFPLGPVVSLLLQPRFHHPLPLIAMHLRYVSLLVATLFARSTAAESATNASIPSFTKNPSPSTQNLDAPLSSVKSALHSPSLLTVNQTSSAKAHTSSGANEEKTLLPTTSKLYKALHKDVNLSKHVRATLERQLWLASDMSPTRLFHKLHLDEVPDDELLENVDWKNWAIFVCKKEKEKVDSGIVVARAMRSEMSEKRLVTMLKKGMQKSSTKEIAKLLMEAKEDLWLDHRKPTDVFIGLELDEHAEDLFGNVLYPTWSNFVRAYAAKHQIADNTDLQWLKKVFYHDHDLLSVLTSPKNLDHRQGHAILKQFLHEQSDSTNFFKALMHSRRGLRAYFTKYKLENEEAQDKIMELTDLTSAINLKALRKLSDIMSLIYPKPEHVLRVLPVDDPLLKTWISFMKKSTVRMPVGEPEIETLNMLISKDTEIQDSASIVHSFVKLWVDKSVEPSKVYEMVLAGKGQDATKSQAVWKMFIHEYETKANFRLSMDSPTSVLNINRVADAEENEHEIPEEIKTFMRLSAKAFHRKPDDLKRMRWIVWNWVKTHPEPEQVLKTLLLDADATRLLDHWVGSIDEYLRTIDSAQLKELASQPGNDPSYTKMLRMLKAVGDLGHQPSRMIIRENVLKWLEWGMSTNEVFAMLELDTVTKELLASAKRLLALKADIAVKSVRQRRPSSPQSSTQPSVKASPTVLDEDVATLIDRALSELLDNPLLAVYLDFMNRYKLEHKSRDTLLTTLLAAFGEDDVAKLLNATKKQSEMVQALQEALLERYDKARVSMEKLLKMLGLNARNAQGSPLYDAYIPIYLERQKIEASL